jgi:Fe-S-cluster-containing dehydrogenase component/DMSO reductase anchor subunit
MAPVNPQVAIGVRPSPGAASRDVAGGFENPKAETLLDVAAPRDGRTLIDALLEEQRDLPAVERFARWHDANLEIAARSHRSLIPLTAPGAGEQYAFEVDLDRCSGCKSCVTACHALNGLDENETWRSVGALHGRGRDSFQQTITTACHHCVEPGCLDGCPVLAYDKDPLTGIVRHLDDQCIGCQYCVFMCPYEVPKYSESRGIVRKCDMCHQRLAHHEAPACVQACPSEAIRITVVEKEAVRSQYIGVPGESGGTHRTPKASPQISRPGNSRSVWSAVYPTALTSIVTLQTNLATRQELQPPHLGCYDAPGNRFLPDSPEPTITLPTTRYISMKSLPDDLVAGDDSELELEPAHLPLVWMLVLTQLGAGGFALLPFTSIHVRPVIASVALAAMIAGTAASILHLGRPQKAWRVFLGLRRSWMSREIVVFGLFVSLAAVTTFKTFQAAESAATSVLFSATALLGLVGVICSGMTYHATQRECWRGELSVGRFLGTTLMLGVALAWWSSVLLTTEHSYFAITLILVTLAKLSREFVLLRHCSDEADLDYELPSGLLARSAFLMRFRLGVRLRLRMACAWVGGVALPLLSLLPHSVLGPVATAGLLLCVTGELIERGLFFRAVVVSKMPGGAAS